MRNAVSLFCYLAIVTTANVLLKLSADAGGTGPTLLFFIAGNVAGFAGILVYTSLLRTMPLHVAFPLSRGLVVLGVQIVASLLVFHESIRPTEAAGAVLVAAGILVVGSQRARGEA
jgi:multidrug transporter EmrE-like cation transporter